jgi:hypothetical protein
MNPRGQQEPPPDFSRALSLIPDGYSEGRFDGRRWGVTVERSEDNRRVWLFAEELAGTDIVSFNLYVLETGARLKPCEMSSGKVMEFVIGYRPDAAGSPEDRATG